MPWLFGPSQALLLPLACHCASFSVTSHNGLPFSPSLHCSLSKQSRRESLPSGPGGLGGLPALPCHAPSMPVGKLRVTHMDTGAGATTLLFAGFAGCGTGTGGGAAAVGASAQDVAGGSPRSPRPQAAHAPGSGPAVIHITQLPSRGASPTRSHAEAGFAFSPPAPGARKKGGGTRTAAPTVASSPVMRIPRASEAGFADAGGFGGYAPGGGFSAPTEGLLRRRSTAAPDMLAGGPPLWPGDPGHFAGTAGGAGLMPAAPHGSCTPLADSLLHARTRASTSWLEALACAGAAAGAPVDASYFARGDVTPGGTMTSGGDVLSPGGGTGGGTGAGGGGYYRQQQLQRLEDHAALLQVRWRKCGWAAGMYA